MSILTDTYTLTGGVRIPKLGLGTWLMVFDDMHLDRNDCPTDGEIPRGCGHWISVSAPRNLSAVEGLTLTSGFHRWGMEHGAVDMESAPDLGELVLFRVQFTEFEEHLQGEDYRRLPARSC